MKALSLKQPWAWLVIQGIKDIENRDWSTDYRGPLLIHASKDWDRNGHAFIVYDMRVRVPFPEDLVFGALIGEVNLVDCVDKHSSKWFWGKWGFVFENPREFKKPVPWRGQLGIFDVRLYHQKRRRN